MTTPEPSMQPAHDVLGAPESPSRPRRRGLLLGLAGVGAAVAVAGTAVAAASFLGGGGAQPEDVLPADALGMVKVDLDPAAGQKVAAYRLAKKFPTTAKEVKDEDSVKDELLSALFSDEDEVDYDKDVKPWIGDRLGAALLPGGDEPSPVVAVAYTDRAKAEKAMEDLAAEDDEVFYAFSKKADYLLVGEDQGVVDAAAGTKEVLSGTAGWEKGMDALDGDQILTAWADLDAIYEALPQEARDEAAQAYGLETDEFTLGGMIVAGAHAAADHVEVVGKAIDLESPIKVETPVGGGDEGGSLVTGLPADTVAAMSISNLGPGLAELFGSAYGEDDPLGIVASAQEFGISLPDDLRTLLGDQTVGAAFGEEDVALRTRTDDVDAAYDIANRLAEVFTGGGDTSSVLRRLDDGIAAGSTPEALDAISAGDGGLGQSEAFETAVPDADEAGYLFYVDIARALELSGEELGEGEQDARQLQAVGISGTGDQTSSTFRLRLTVKDE